MSKYTVHLLSPYMSWDGVVAESEEGAINKCDFPEEIDLSDGPYHWVALPEEDDGVMFDPTFGVSAIAMNIAEYIRFEPGDSMFTWSPFYNGRERGIALTIRKDFIKVKSWIFGENRNSDDIFLDVLVPHQRFQGFTGTLVLTPMNPPSLSDFTEEDWRKRRMFRDPDEVIKAINSEVDDFLMED